MEIVIYWDSLFLLNFIMNYWILHVLTYKFSLGVKGIRVAFASFLGAGIYALCMLVDVGTRWTQLLEMCISIPLMVLVMLPRKDRRLFWKIMFSGLFYTFLVAGILRTIFAKGQLLAGMRLHILAVITLGYVIAEGMLIYLYKQKQGKNQRLFEVTLKNQGKEASVQALLDTGNSLIEPISKKPVCLLESDILEALIDRDKALFRVIPYRSVGCEGGILYGVEIEEVALVYDGKELSHKGVVCAKTKHKLSTNDTYKMILHPECIREI